MKGNSALRILLYTYPLGNRLIYTENSSKPFFEGRRSGSCSQIALPSIYFATLNQLLPEPRCLQSPYDVSWRAVFLRSNPHIKLWDCFDHPRTLVLQLQITGGRDFKNTLSEQSECWQWFPKVLLLPAKNEFGMVPNRENIRLEFCWQVIDLAKGIIHNWTMYHVLTRTSFFVFLNIGVWLIHQLVFVVISVVEKYHDCRVFRNPFALNAYV